MNSNFVRLVQLSDTHLFKDEQRTLLGVSPNQSLQAVLGLLKQDDVPPDVIIHTGDMSQDETQASYQYFADQINAFDTPIHYIRGNHDTGSVQDAVLKAHGISSERQIRIGSCWQILLLNSQQPGEIFGALSDPELDFLQKGLKQNPKLFTVVALHHNPISNGRIASDKHMLQNSQEFWEILKKYPQVKVVLCGHVHQDFHCDVSGIQYFSSPSTWVQFDRSTPHFSLENIPQGYRWLTLFDNGEIDCGVKRLEKYVGVFEQKPKTY